MISMEEIEFEGQVYVLTELQAKVVRRLLETKNLPMVRHVLAQRALDVQAGSQVAPGGASNPPISDQAPKAGDPLQPRKTSSAPAVDEKKESGEGGDKEEAGATAEKTQENQEGLGNSVNESVPGEEDPGKKALLERLEIR